MPEKKPPEEKTACPFCLKEFPSEDALREHASEHNVIDIYNSLDARMGSRIEGVSAAMGKAMADLIAKTASVFDERSKKIEERIAERPKEPEPRREAAPGTETGPGEVSMGEAARLEQGAQAVAEGARRAGINIRGEHIGPILSGLGQLAVGLRGPSPRGESPFEEAGKSMFVSFSKAMTEAVARVLGKRVGAEVVEHE